MIGMPSSEEVSADGLRYTKSLCRLLHTLRVRYALDMIYTYSGEILIAANPHKRLKQLYGPRMMAQYKGVPLGELSPHVYAIAEQAFSAMMIDDQQQAILISGESGAGKTESAKTVMQYLAQRAGRSQKDLHSSKSTKLRPMMSVSAAPIEEQVLESNPLLEAFGNAKTVRNDNSSRFGKFTDMQFDVSGNVSGAAISTYLLERSRVVSINNPERSYHIFYQLCAGSDSEQRKTLGLQGGAASFNYLSTSSTFTLPGVDDAEGFRQTIEAMRIVGMKEQERDAVLQLVACVLHLGNIEFVCNDDDEAIPASDSAWTALSMASTLLEVKQQDLLKALTTRSIDLMGEKIVKHLDLKGALVSRDSMAKNIYSKLFDWLVSAINRKISALGQGQAGKRSIGILDIYGFESFKENSFEQLCINLANERLQQQFNQQVFKGEQEEYAREGIDWSYIEFVDNQDCLELLEGGAVNPNMAIFPLIDEACRMPKATHEDLAQSLRSNLASQGRFVAPKRPQHSFGVKHYAGQVTYLTNFIMDKNKDFVIKEHQELMMASGSGLVRDLFQESEVVEPVSAKRGGRSAFKLNSVGLQFRKQLHGLMAALNQCQPHYIRCIKPNPESRPGSLTPPYVLEQLRAGGVLEAVRIASAGFPTRKTFKPFAQRYCVLLASGKGTYEPLDMKTLSDEEAAAISRQILKATRADGWQMGKTRIFLRAGQLALLEGARGRRLAQSAIVIQSAFRCMAAKRQLRHARQCATRIQAHWRGILGRRLALEARKDKAVVTIQATWRMFKVRRAFLAQRKAKAATLIQSFVRMQQQRKRFRKATDLGKRQAARAAKQQERTNAAIVLQKYARRRLAVRKIATVRAERARWIQLEQSNASMREELEMWKARFHKEAARSDELAADNAQLQSELAALRASKDAARSDELTARNTQLQAELMAARLEIENAVDAGNAKAALATRNSSGLSQRLVQDLEAAQQAAQTTLLAEMEQVRRQKATAEERHRRADENVGHLKDQTRTLHNQLEAITAKLHDKDLENGKLWDQMRMAATEYQQEFLNKETTIRDLLSRNEAEKDQMREDMLKARADMEADIEAMKDEMQTEIDKLQNETRVRFNAQREASEKSIHFSARIMGLNSRVASLAKQLKESKAREAALAAELEAARKQGKQAHNLPPPGASFSLEDGNGIPNGGGVKYGHRKISSKSSQRSLQRDSFSQQDSFPHQDSFPQQMSFQYPDTFSYQESLAKQESSPQQAFESLNSLAQQESSPQQAFESLNTLGTTSVPMSRARENSQGGANVLSMTEEQAVSLLDSTVLPKKLPSLNIQYGNSQLQSIDLPVASWFMTQCLLNWADLWGPLAAEAAGLKLIDSMLKTCEPEILSFQSYWLVTTVATGSLVKVQSMGHPGRQALVKLGDTLIELTPLHAFIATSVMEMLPVDMNHLFSQQAKDLARAGSVGLPRSNAYEMHYFESLGNSPWKTLLGSLSNVVETLRQEGAPPPLVKAVVTAALRYVDAELLNALMLRRDCCSTQAVRALQAGLNHIHAWAAYVGTPFCGRPEEIDDMLNHTTEAAAYILVGKQACMRKVLVGKDILGDLREACPALTLQQIYKLTEHHHDDWISDDHQNQTFALLDALKAVVEKNERAAGNRDYDNDNTYERSSTSNSWEEEETLLLDPQAAFVLPRNLLNEAAKYFVKEGPTPTNPEGGRSLLDQIQSLCRSSINIPRRLRGSDFVFLQS